MRIAIVSDIHGNRTAFQAVLADLRGTSPDLILHGGDLAESGSSPAEIVDHVRDLGWPGVLGNADETQTRPESLEEFARQSSAPPALWTAVRKMAAATGERLGAGRIAWLSKLPHVLFQEQIALVHASPDDLWRSPGQQTSDAELQSIYETLGRPIAVYGHIHRSFARRIALPHDSEMLVVNTGSVSLSYDGDPRAAYLLLDDSTPVIRRVEYDIEKEVAALGACGLPHSDWIARMLRSAAPEMP